MQGVHQGHLTLTAENLISVFVQVADLDSSRFEIRAEQVGNDQGSDSEQLIVEDPDDEHKVSEYKLWSKKKERFVKLEETIKVKISKMQIAQGTLVLYATMD